MSRLRSTFLARVLDLRRPRITKHWSYQKGSRKSERQLGQQASQILTNIQGLRTPNCSWHHKFRAGSPQADRGEKHPLQREPTNSQHVLGAVRVGEPPLHPHRHHTVAKQGSPTQVKMTLREQVSCPVPETDDPLVEEEPLLEQIEKTRRARAPATGRTATRETLCAQSH